MDFISDKYNEYFELFNRMDKVRFPRGEDLRFSYRMTDLVLEAGQISLHDVYMFHASGANRTDRRRAGFVVRLMPGSSFYDHELGEEYARQHPYQDYGNRALFLLRGEDKTGRNNFAIGH